MLIKVWKHEKYANTTKYFFKKKKFKPYSHAVGKKPALYEETKQNTQEG